MRLRMIAIALGIASVGALPALPATSILLATLPLLCVWLLYRRTYFSLLILIMLGALWGIHFGHGLLNAQLPSELETVDIWLQGTVKGLPVDSVVRGKPVQRFDLDIDSPLCADSQLSIACVKGVKRLNEWHDGYGALDKAVGAAKR